MWVVKQSEVVAHLTWRSDEADRRDRFSFETPVGRALAWLRIESGVGEFVLRVDATAGGRYIEPRKYCALGALAFCEFPTIGGSSAQMSIGAVPREWVEGVDRVLWCFREAHLEAKIEGRTLRFWAASPADLLKRAGVVLFALDTYTRSHVSKTGLDGIKRAAAKVFQEDGAEVLELLNQPIGALFRRQRAPSLQREKARLDDAIVSELALLGYRNVVQFDCGRGGLIQKLVESGDFCEVIGVDSKLPVKSRPPIRHGSLLEPPVELMTDSVALLVNALPTDSRLERVSDVLFSELGFEAVLCVQSADGPTWEQSALDAWAKSISSRFHYETGARQIAGCRAALLRRGKISPPRKQVRQLYTPEIELKTGSRVRIDIAQWKSTVEAFSKRTVDPRWLIYLPPGLCSAQKSEVEGPLEHPRAAFDYYRAEGIRKLVVEYKHMGSRAIAIVCRDEDVGERRFGQKALGCIYTRNGRPFWDNAAPVLETLRAGLDRAKFWERFDTDWVCLDGELLPWSLKAEDLIEDSHGEMLLCGEENLDQLAAHLPRLCADEKATLDERRECFRRYRRLCDYYRAQVGEPYSFAPFHLIATEGRSYFDRTHNWHMEIIKDTVRRAGEPFSRTPYQSFSLSDEKAVHRCVEWWEELSASGAEGVVVKPLYYVPRGRRGMAQPGFKCRGAEHLRMVYGPEYDRLENRWALAERDALSRRREKHRRVLKQVAVSVEGVQRFVAGESPARVEACARAVLALDKYEG